MKNKRIGIVRMLLDHPKTCLKQASMKYGTPLHVVLSNQEFGLSVKVVRMMKNQKEISEIVSQINKIDEEGNTPLHILMRNFSADPDNSAKIGRTLIRRGANLKL